MSESDIDLAEECRIWSVPGRMIDAFTRAEARRVWSFRNRLSPTGQHAFDRLKQGPMGKVVVRVNGG